MKVAAAIITWNGEQYIGPCLESLASQTHLSDVVIVDNASTDETLSVARARAARLSSRGASFRLLLQDRNVGYTRAANIALSALLAGPARYDAIVLMNQDVTLAPDCVTRLLDVLERIADAGAVGCKLYYPGGITVQHAGGYLTRPRLVGQHYGQGQHASNGSCSAERDVEFVTGAAIALRVRCLDAVGLFDEIFSPGYYEDVDLCDRIRRAGWRVVYTPLAQGHHVESASFPNLLGRLTLSHRNRLAFALPQLTEPAFAEEFRVAERDALAAEPSEMVRSLALAYLQATLQLHRIARTRLSPSRFRGPVVAALAELIISLRADCLTELRHRRQTGFHGSETSHRARCPVDAPPG